MGAGARPPLEVKLLLDEMYGAAVAEELRVRGHDATAVVEQLEWRGQDDLSLLRWAVSHERVVVSENVADFARLHGELLAEGATHPGVVLVQSRHYPRSPDGRMRIVKSLDRFLTSPPAGLEAPFLWWLT